MVNNFELKIYFVSRMPTVYDEKFHEEKRVSRISGKMFNRLQREYIAQYSDEKQKEYYLGLHQGKIGEFPSRIPEYLQ